MTDWSNLEHAHGEAGDVPPLLAGLSPVSTAEVWGELWTRLCHQGTVYSASFAALPILADVAERWRPADRRMILMLASSILASDDVHGSREDFLRPVASVIPRFQEFCRESLALPNVPQAEFVNLLQSALAFDGERFWGRELGLLISGESSGNCPHCDCSLFLFIGKQGFFTRAWDEDMTSRRPEIEPNRGMLPGVGEWMVQQARSSRQDEVADWMRWVFGSTQCPTYGKGFRVPDGLGWDGGGDMPPSKAEGGPFPPLAGE